MRAWLSRRLYVALEVATGVDRKPPNVGAALAKDSQTSDLSGSPGRAEGRTVTLDSQVSGFWLHRMFLGCHLESPDVTVFVPRTRHYLWLPSGALALWGGPVWSQGSLAPRYQRQADGLELGKLWLFLCVGHALETV